MKRIKPSEGNKAFCMAPWTHTYLSPQTERRLCCASREPAQSFRQYIDTGNDANEYKPLTLKEHWNSEHMRSVRLRMMAGEELSECEVCTHKLLNTDVYRSYWNQLFADKIDEAYNSTDDTGATTMPTISFIIVLTIYAILNVGCAEICCPAVGKQNHESRAPGMRTLSRGWHHP